MLTAIIKRALFALIFTLILCSSLSASADWNELINATARGVPAAERVDRCITLIKHEMNKPSESYFGVGGGPIDTGYFQCVTMLSVCEWSFTESERLSIRRCILSHLGSLDTANTPLRDRLMIMLGATGDHLVVDELIRIAGTHPEGYMRLAAVDALGEIREVSAIPVLEHLLAVDTFTRISLEGPSEDLVHAPVRWAAAQALGRMGMKVSSRTDIIDKSYGVSCVEPLLYSKNPYTAQSAVHIIREIGGSDAIAALNRFVSNMLLVSVNANTIFLAESALVELRTNLNKSGDCDEWRDDRCVVDHRKNE